MLINININYSTEEFKYVLYCKVKSFSSVNE